MFNGSAVADTGCRCGGRRGIAAGGSDHIRTSRHGERLEQASFRDRWRVRMAGRLVHAEEFRLGPDVAAELQAGAVANGANAVATVLLISGNAESHMQAVRDIVGEEGGASLWQVGKATKLAARLYAPDSYTLRKRLAPLLALLNGKAGLPKVWTM